MNQHLKARIVRKLRDNGYLVDAMKLELEPSYEELMEDNARLERIVKDLNDANRVLFKPEQPDKDTVKGIRDVPLQDGDWAVECTNPGHFLKVHPSEFGKMASNPAYSYYRAKADCGGASESDCEAAESADGKPDGQAENAKTEGPAA